MDRPAIANGLMTEVTTKSDTARLAIKARPTSDRCFMVTVAMTTRLP